MITLIKNAGVYSPGFLGNKDVLLAGSKIYKIADEITLSANVDIQVLDASEKFLFPGFIDSHVHIAGGGGEGGFLSRTPEIMLSDITLGGVTTVIGTLGTDGTTRSMANLLAKANGLEEEGITTFINTGSYQIPVKTLTGSITDDIVLIEKIIGVGEIAISDHRSSHPSFDELVRLTADARLGGMLAGKAGTVNIHMGDSMQMLDLIERVVDNTDIPMKHFVPTHMNRNPYLFKKCLDYAARGGYVDFTTSTVPQFIAEGEIPAYQTLKIMQDRQIPIDGITFSSDGQGSMPNFDEKGNMTGMSIGKVMSLYQSVRDAIQIDGIEIDKALSVITSNPSRIYKLKGKGHIQEGFDADLVLVHQDTLAIDTVFAKGQLMVENEQAIVKGIYE